MNDPVNPNHYKQSGSFCECGKEIEAIQITEGFNFCRGNAIKYIWRAGKKSNEIEDLKKARWYLEREISRLENEMTVQAIKILESQ